jgi:hypothetical protein
VQIHGSTNFHTSKLAARVSCAQKFIIIGNRCNVHTKRTSKNDQPIIFAFRLLNKVEQNYILQREKP